MDKSFIVKNPDGQAWTVTKRQHDFIIACREILVLDRFEDGGLLIVDMKNPNHPMYKMSTLGLSDYLGVWDK